MSTQPHRIEILSEFKSEGKYLYSVQLLHFQTDGTKRAVQHLTLFEDDIPLTLYEGDFFEIQNIGLGFYHHSDRVLYFSSSDNSDPNLNGRVYSFSINHTNVKLHDKKPKHFLKRPFGKRSDSCWIALTPHYGDDVSQLDRSTISLLEDGSPLGPAHSEHNDIDRWGSGRYSHWMNHIYFSSSDGSDPNTNKRVYSYHIREADKSSDAMSVREADGLL